MLRDPLLLLEDILECAEKISAYVEKVEKASFMGNGMLQDAVIRNLEIIGEAAKGLPEAFRDQHEEIQWRKISALRNILAHAYFGIDNEVIWDLATKEVPLLRERVVILLQRPPHYPER